MAGGEGFPPVDRAGDAQGGVDHRVTGGTECARHLRPHRLLRPFNPVQLDAQRRKPWRHRVFNLRHGGDVGQHGGEQIEEQRGPNPIVFVHQVHKTEVEQAEPVPTLRVPQIGDIGIEALQPVLTFDLLSGMAQDVQPLGGRIFLRGAQGGPVGLVTFGNKRLDRIRQRRVGKPACPL